MQRFCGVSLNCTSSPPAYLPWHCRPSCSTAPEEREEGEERGGTRIMRRRMSVPWSAFNRPLNSYSLPLLALYSPYLRGGRERREEGRFRHWEERGARRDEYCGEMPDTPVDPPLPIARKQAHTTSDVTSHGPAHRNVGIILHGLHISATSHAWMHTRSLATRKFMRCREHALVDCLGSRIGYHIGHALAQHLVPARGGE